MITAVKTKRGGDMADANENGFAATRKQRSGEIAHAAEGLGADLPSGDNLAKTDEQSAAGETTGVNPSDTDHDGAQNGRATARLKPMSHTPGRSKTKRGAGVGQGVTGSGLAGSADTENGAAVECSQPNSMAPRRSCTRGKGETRVDTEKTRSRPAKTKGRANGTAQPIESLHGPAADGEKARDNDDQDAICRQLSPLQRARYTAIRMRIRVDNGIGSYIASQLGDGADKSEADRQRIRKVADELIACVWKAKPLKHPEHEAVIAANLGMIEAAGIASNAFQGQIDRLAKAMESLAKQLPIAKWLDLPEQNGIGLLSVAAIIGECGTDHGQLPDYRNPSCVWKRMGCAPYQGKMASTWRSGKEGKASAEDWVAMGYCPRRRSLMYVIGEGIVKQNGEGPYRKRYDETKERAAAAHPDWSKGRCHSHGMLLASKLLLKNLWIEMRKS